MTCPFVRKVLEQEFAGKTKCIFIDPLYNTGHEEAPRGGDAIGWRLERGGSPQEVGSESADLPPMVAELRWGKGGDGPTAEGTGEGERVGLGTGGGSGVGHFNSQVGSHGKMRGLARQREEVRHVEEVLEVIR